MKTRMNNQKILLTVKNQESKPIIYRNTPTVLHANIFNQTGEDILIRKVDGSEIKIYFPDEISKLEIGNMKIDLDGWDFKISDSCLLLYYTNIDNYVWENNSELSFIIANIITEAQPVSDIMQVNILINEINEVQATSIISIENLPLEVNVSLKEILQVSFENQGRIFVSTNDDPLRNTLYLNIKNTSKENICTGSSDKMGYPQISVKFIYGYNSGSLTPIEAGISSAWNIKGEFINKQGDIWKVAQPQKSDETETPEWILTPADTNKILIGTSGNSNITFKFSNIVSFAPPGHTQAIVSFRGFRKDNEIEYDDATFIVDIVKRDQIITCGSLGFFSEDSEVYFYCSENCVLNVNWLLFRTHSIKISATSINRKQEIFFTNNNCCVASPLEKGNAEITLNDPTPNELLIIALQSFDNKLQLLNNRQISVIARDRRFIDPQDSKAYKTVLIGNTLWMAEDYSLYTNGAYRNKDGVVFYSYSNMPTPKTPGWRIPTIDDWKKLITFYGGTSEAYKKLIFGGNSGFNAKLNGYYDHKICKQGKYGYFLTSEKDKVVSFSSNSNETVLFTIDSSYYFTLRYIRDL